MRALLRLALLLIAAATWVGCEQSSNGTKKVADVIVKFRTVDGRTLSLDDLQRITGPFRYEIIG